MKGYWKNVKEASDCIRKQFEAIPSVGMITDVDLMLGERTFSFEQTLAYRDIPNFPVGTNMDHGGKIIVAKVDGQQLLVFQGRFNLYEGYSALEIAFPVRVMKNLGVKHLIVTDVAGGVNPDFNPGDIMLIQDHINLTGENPLIGTNHESWGERFPDMSRVYDVALAPIIEEIVRYEKMGMRKGVYAGRPGPSLEAPGDVPFLKTIGADAVGFATILEVIAAVHSGMKITGLSIISDVENLYRSPHVSVASILEAANEAASVISMLTSKIVSESGARN
ncbi:MAG: purine-nucleoside phosphorylase [Thermodesulfobacteriota bacterium]